MKKIGVILGLCVIVLLVIGVFVAAADLVIDEGIPEFVDRVAGSLDSADKIVPYVVDFIDKRQITSDKISKMTEVNFDDLPKEVNIENVGDSNLAIYQIDYEEDGKEDKLFVVTYSVEELRAQGDLIIAHDKRQSLQFGFAGEMIVDGFLETATGVTGSLEKGYVMMRPGSITGLSTNLEVVNSGVEQIDIIIYKNGKQIGFGNSLNAEVGVQIDYDVQSKDVVTFVQGDVISVYVDAPDKVVWKDVITMVEITTIN